MFYRLCRYDTRNSKLYDYVTTNYKLKVLSAGYIKKDIFVKAYCSMYDNSITLTAKEKFIVEMSDFDVEFSKVKETLYNERT